MAAGNLIATALDSSLYDMKNAAVVLDNATPATQSKRRYSTAIFVYGQNVAEAEVRFHLAH